MAELNPISLPNLCSRTNFSSSPAVVSFRSFKIAANCSNENTNIRRRLGLGLGLGLGLIGSMAVGAANALDLKLIAPGQSFEEAESGIRGHAEALLQVRGLIESEAWKEAQKRLRSSSPALKQDLHTIIEYKPPAERPPLRKLYSLLFNNVTRMDYAARDKDAERVWQCYDNIVTAISDILSRI